MALPQLTDEQIRTWTRSQKDRWWFENVYRGDMPQLTLRSAVTGFLLGGLLAATNLYIGGKTGITTGVGLTSVILAFALYRALAKSGVVQDFTILENNCTQSIATAAGYMTSPLISALAAYMIVTGKIIPWWHMLAWMLVVSVLGVFLAFPMKRRFVNEDQLPFPEGRAAGVVLDALYHGKAEEGLYKARLLGWSSALAAAVNFISGDGFMRLTQFSLLRMNRWLGMEEPWVWPERIDTYYYNLAARFHLWTPSILNTDFRTLGLRLTLDLSMIGVGGLMGMAVATSCLLGAFINFVILAPIMIQHGDIIPRVAANGAVIPITRAEIVNQWSLWWAVVMMVVGSLVSLLGRPELFRGLFRRSERAATSGEPDVLKSIELPLWMSAVAVPLLTVLGALVSHEFFGVPWLLAFISFPLIFVLTIICTNSMALTSWTPTGSLAKITQFTMAIFDRSNPASNLIPGGMTAEISSNAANLLSDIKPGYMLGAKPRQQAVGHVIGIFSGALASVPLFYLLFLPPAKDGTRSVATLVSDQFAMPAAVQWRGVADLIAHGLRSLPASAVASMLVAAVCAAAIEIARIVTKGRFPLSAVSIGLGVVLPPEYVFTMWLGAALFWWQGRKHPKPGTAGHNFWVEGCEPICAGLIAGWALTGIANSIINVLCF
ncbi:MAG TPA: OPT family oligopeptide transporter [Opitutaceae bacterium]|nr:OPT family oligopeptide transporter [Opitutaceae bacterium]HND60544.1 OPT family oligopeptide transporter [Opitutaceae bacterium]